MATDGIARFKMAEDHVINIKKDVVNAALAEVFMEKDMMTQSDVTNIPSLFLRNPDWQVSFDNDGPLAVQTRHKIYDIAAPEKVVVSGYHFPYPCVGHVEKEARAIGSFRSPEIRTAKADTASAIDEKAAGFGGLFFCGAVSGIPGTVRGLD